MTSRTSTDYSGSAPRLYGPSELRIRSVSVAGHRSSGQFHALHLPDFQQAVYRPNITSSAPVPIPTGRVSRRSFEIPMSPERRRASSSLHSSSPEIQIEELDKKAFIKLLKEYQNYKRDIDYVLTVFTRNINEIKSLMQVEGQDFIISLGDRQVECITRLFIDDAKMFPDSVPLRENTLCTAFYREYCMHHFGTILRGCASDPKIFTKKKITKLNDENKEKLLVRFVETIIEKLSEADMMFGLRTIHKHMCSCIRDPTITNFKAFTIVNFINRVVAPIFTNASVHATDQAVAQVYKTFGIHLHKHANMYLAGTNLSSKEITLFDKLADCLYAFTL